KYNKAGTNLQGNINTIIRNNGRVYQIKGNSMTSLSVQPAPCVNAPCGAVFNGKANIQDITGPVPIAIDGNATLQVTMTDNVEPPQPVVAKPSSPPNERVAARTAGPYRDLIRAAATRHALAPELIESVILVESNFEARAVSRKGARGLMQLMPATAARLGVRNVFDVRQNVEGGVRHLRYLVDLYGGNLALVLVAPRGGTPCLRGPFSPGGWLPSAMRYLTGHAGKLRVALRGRVTTLSFTGFFVSSNPVD